MCKTRRRKKHFASEEWNALIAVRSRLNISLLLASCVWVAICICKWYADDMKLVFMKWTRLLLHRWPYECLWLQIWDQSNTLRVKGQNSWNVCRRILLLWTLKTLKHTVSSDWWLEKNLDQSDDISERYRCLWLCLIIGLN